MRNLGLVGAIFVMTAVSSSASAAPMTLVALGDSLTQGYGLPPEDGFVPQLQAWLEAKGVSVNVVNAGVSGDTTAGGLARIDWTLTPDVRAMIVTLGGNDLLRGLPPEEARANLDGILAKATEHGTQVLLVPMAAPSNYGPDYKSAFDAIYPELAAKYHALLSGPFLAPILAQADRSKAMAEYVQPDGLHPNAKGVALIVDGLGPQVLELLARAKP
jgi:acyl-CoA thioesterase-1